MIVEAKSTFIRSFGYALEGIVAALKGRNFRIIVCLGFLATIAAFYLRFTASEWVLLIMTISVVIVAEMVNTAIEAIVDLVSPQIRDKAKIAKDVAVAGVFIASVFSITVGVLLFLPKILR